MVLDAARLSIEVDSRQVEQATGSLNRLEQAGTRAERGAARAARGFRKVSGQTNTVVGGTRNVALQLSQVAQQGQVTGDYLQALAIQLPDLALGFGTVGAAIGVVAGVLVGTFGPQLLGVGKDLESLNEDLDESSKLLKAYADNLLEASKSIDELSLQFGSTSEAMQPILRDLAAIEKIRASEALDQIFDSLADGYVRLYDDSNVRELQKVGGLLGLTGGIIFGGDRDANRRQIALITNDLRGLQDAANFTEQAEIASRLRDNFVSIVGPVETMNNEQREFYSTLLRASQQANILASTEEVIAKKAEETTKKFKDASSEALDLSDRLKLASDWGIRLDSIADAMSFEAAIQDANALASALQLGAGWANSIAVLLAVAKQSVNTINSVPALGPGESGLFTIQDYINSPTFERGERPSTSPKPAPNNIDALVPEVTGGGGGGGSSVSEVDRLAEAYDDLLRSLDPAYAALREFQEGQDLLNQALAAGVIDADQFAGGLDLLQTQYDEAIDKTKELNEASQFFGDAITDAALNGADSLEGLIDALRRAAFEAAFLGTGPLASIFGGGVEGGLWGQLTGSAKGNVFSGGRIRAFARGGVISGPTVFPMTNGTGLMGEAGPEAIMPLSRDASGNLGVKSQGQQRVMVEIFVNDDGTLGHIARQAGAVSGAAAGAKAAPAAVANDIARNGVTSRALRGSFALTRNKRGG
tara:strand:- start:10746 stop:12854 length:2109 start_codon:yes stop_codon:yes gene_type:complete